MKHFLSIVACIALCAGLQAQQIDTGLVCFTAKQVKTIAVGVQTLKWRIAYQDTLIVEQSLEIATFETLCRIKDSSIATQKRQIAILRTNEELHAESETALKSIIEQNKPRLYEHPVLWVVVGLTTGYFLFDHKQ